MLIWNPVQYLAAKIFYDYQLLCQQIALKQSKAEQMNSEIEISEIHATSQASEPVACLRVGTVRIPTKAKVILRSSAETFQACDSNRTTKMISQAGAMQMDIRGL